jgi:hypothetical protein
MDQLLRIDGAITALVELAAVNPGRGSAAETANSRAQEEGIAT